MKISKVTYKILDDYERRGNSVALCSIVFDKVFTVHKTLVCDSGEGNLVVRFPFQSNRKHIQSPGYGNIIRNMYHPSSASFSRYITSTVLDGYRYCLDSGDDVYYPDGE